MKRRLNMAAGLIHQPRLVLMDEPTVGVDPQSRNRIFEMIEALRTQGMTIIYTTHYMEEAERLCDRIAIVDHGRIIALDTKGSAGVQLLRVAQPGNCAPRRPCRESSAWVAGTRWTLVDGTAEFTIERIPLKLPACLKRSRGRP
jgi:ABC-type multidrug transport system ATPase subunit